MKHKIISVAFCCVAIQLPLVKTKSDTKPKQQQFTQENVTENWIKSDPILKKDCMSYFYYHYILFICLGNCFNLNDLLQNHSSFSFDREFMSLLLCHFPVGYKSSFSGIEQNHSILSRFSNKPTIYHFILRPLMFYLVAHQVILSKIRNIALFCK